jgi:hypothetical protein
MKTRFLLVLCPLLFASCKQTGENRAIAMPDAGAGMVVTVPRVYPHAINGVKEEDAALYDGKTPVYEVRLRSYLYVVNGVIAGMGERALREYLTRQKRGSIKFYSDFNGIMSEADAELNKILTEQSSQVQQFWGCASTEMDNDDDETCDYVIKLYADIHTVNSVVVGEDMLSLREYLAVQKKGVIFFESDLKFVDKVTQEYMGMFAELGFQVNRFLMPRSTRSEFIQ